ncbi:YhdP family protein [Vreelandella olivaria]|uniref:YhdP family phospholipid transporter n=1 Tax=Vreelandella olivaria TaxID=390919 RepID=UPI00201E9DDE|nr:AsmA-like C-terminal region-containing protein [Halomonas olivaria]
MALRSLARWCLPALAWFLGSLAVLLLLMRLLISQVGALTPKIEALLEARIGVPVSIEHLSLTLERNDLALRIEGLEAVTPVGQHLMSLESAHLRLDSWASLLNAAPVFNDARVSGLEFHLYQQEDVIWGWPDPAELPLFLAPDPELNLAAIDKWAGIILRQRLWVDNTLVVLHGRQEEATLHAPRLLLTGDERRTRLEGAINILESPSQRSEEALPALNMQAEMQPGRRGFGDFSAALQLDMQLDHLVALVAVLRPENMAHVEQAGGVVKLWGRWHAGGLDEARLEVDIPQLTLRHNGQYAILRDIEANGLWQRDDDGGEAWLSGNAESAEWVQPEGVSDGPALPQHWYLTHQPGSWELRTSAFELASLVAWREYVLLPESVTRVLQTLSPSGQVQGLRVGQHEGHWGVDAALTNVTVLPWQQAPGGGPLDAWVQARDFRGRVTFNSAGDSTLHFPELFAAPMQLRHAEGVVEWVYDGPNTMISGRNLHADWDGAQVSGGFGLVTGNQSGQFGLDIDFANVDALEYPLSQWLPIKTFETELREWLLDDVGGYVPRGSLQLSLPLSANVSVDQLSATLALSITQGHLPIAPEWPRLDEVEGRLLWRGQVLEARIDRAQSHGVEASEGELVMADELLNLSGRLSSDGQSLIELLQAIPDVDMSLLSDVHAAGSVEGDIALSLPLKNPESLQLEIHAIPDLTTIAYQPLALPLTNVGGELTWQQHGQNNTLLGNAHGQLLGGHIEADINTQEEGIALHGDLDTAALFRLANISPEQGRQVFEGRTQWSGLVRIEPTPSVTLESRLLGVVSHLPAPFDKAADQPWSWRLTADTASGRLETQLAGVASARIQRLQSGRLAGELALAGAAPLRSWPAQPGVQVSAELPELDLMAWQASLAPLMQGQSHASRSFDGFAMPVSMMFSTPCLRYRGECFGELNASGSIEGQQIGVRLSGDLGAGRVAYQPDADRPLDIMLTSLAVDRLLDMPSKEHDSDTPAPASWVEAVETEHASVVPIPSWLADFPDGRLRLAEVTIGESRFGPLTAYWQTNDQRFSLSPVGLTLGQLSVRGELFWEGSAVNSRTRADITIQGGDVGTALERLDQPVAMRSRTTSIDAELMWPGAPWQFDLSRAGGELSTDIRNGRFVTLDSTPARLVGLLNFDNILRRLRLDFSDVTGQGTAFDRVYGTADVAGGQLMLRGPLRIEAPATTLTLTGSVNLIQRELDQRLGVSLPVTQSLPIAAIAVGAPIVGGALFIADQLFGDALDRATTIHYRVRGPWTSPQVILEGP